MDNYKSANGQLQNRDQLQNNTVNGAISITVNRVIKGEIWWLYDLKLQQAMRNLTCGDQQILVLVIWLVPTKAQTEEISYYRTGSCISSTCFMGSRECETVEIACNFWGIVVGWFKCGTKGWPSKEEFL